MISSAGDEIAKKMWGKQYILDCFQVSDRTAGNLKSQLKPTSWEIATQNTREKDCMHKCALLEGCLCGGRR